MNPSTTSLGSHHGADDLDDQFEYVEQDIPSATRSGDREDERDTAADTGIPTERKAPHIMPKIAPPKQTRRYSATELPEIGTWVAVNTLDGKRKETLHGRVVVITTDRIRLKQGAGWWDIPLGSVTGITAGDDPAHRGR